jgi:DNA polymerase-3 subunit beta
MQENLLRGLATVSRAISSRALLPILSHVLIEAAEGQLKLSATDLETSITCALATGVAVEEEGAIAVPARLLGDFVKTLPPDRVEMTSNAQTQTLNIRCERYRANLKGMPAAEFPTIPQLGDDTTRVVVDAPTLRALVEQVAFAAATNEARPILTGVHLVGAENRVRGEASDGFRLSVRTAPVKAMSGSFDVVVPAAVLKDLARICTDQDDVDIRVAADGKYVRFHLGAVVVTALALDGTFPDVSRAIPAEHVGKAVVGLSDLQSVSKIVSAFANHGGRLSRPANGIRLTADVAKNSLTVWMQDAERGDGVGNIDAALEGEWLKVILQAPYLLDVLGCLTAPQVAIEKTVVNGNPGPVVFRPVGDSDFVHLIMPVAETGKDE